MPDMQYVDSSNVEAVGYDSASQELHVRFLKSGATYIYYGVEEWVFDQFLQAESKGIFLNQEVKARYSYGRA